MEKGNAPADSLGPDPDPGSVAAMRSTFWALCRAQPSWHPQDVWGVLLTFRWEVSGDYLPRNRPVTTEDRAKALEAGLLFWSLNAHLEMVMTGLLPPKRSSPAGTLDHALTTYNRWLDEVFMPSIEDPLHDADGRGASIRALFSWSIKSAQDCGQVDREETIRSVSGTLRRSGLGSLPQGIRGQAVRQVLDQVPSDAPIAYFTREGALRVNPRGLRDSTPLLRNMRRHVQAERRGRSRAKAREVEADTLGAEPDAEEPSPLELLLSAAAARERVEVVRAFRLACDERSMMPPRRRDDRVTPCAREYLYSITLGHANQAEVADFHSLDRGNFSRAYRRELQAVMDTVRARLAI
ncbi:MAG: hypothetical protein AB7T63_14860 [Planctomycetota bacterium]